MRGIRRTVCACGGWVGPWEYVLIFRGCWKFETVFPAVMRESQQRNPVQRTEIRSAVGEGGTESRQATLGLSEEQMEV